MSLDRSFLIALSRSLIGVLLASLGTAALAQTPAEPDPCATMDADLMRAAAEWSSPAIEFKVLDKPEGDAELTAGVKVKVTLFPSEKVTLPKNPRNPEANVVGYSGLVSFRTGKAGPYRILLNQYLWLEMIDASGGVADVGRRAGVLDSNRRLNKCTGMGKNLSFLLTADTLYWLQMTGAKKGPVAEVVMSAPD